MLGGKLKQMALLIIDEGTLLSLPVLYIDPHTDRPRDPDSAVPGFH